MHHFGGTIFGFLFKILSLDIIYTTIYFIIYQNDLTEFEFQGQMILSSIFQLFNSKLN